MFDDDVYIPKNEFFELKQTTCIMNFDGKKIASIWIKCTQSGDGKIEFLKQYMLMPMTNSGMMKEVKRETDKLMKKSTWYFRRIDKRSQKRDGQASEKVYMILNKRKLIR